MKRHFLTRQKVPQRLTRFLLVGLSSAAFVVGGGAAIFLAVSQLGQQNSPPQKSNSPVSKDVGSFHNVPVLSTQNGRPHLSPLPAAEEVWECEVVVVGGSLGGVAAASHAMKAGATTCLIELAPWLGGQISAQGVSAIDESHTMREEQNFSRSWMEFKRSLKQQSVTLPDWVRLPGEQKVSDLNSCWVGKLCFSPQAGAAAAKKQIEAAVVQSPGSKWGTAIAFKGAEFNASGKEITAVYAVRRTPRDPGYTPQGRLSNEIESWYAWNDDSTFDKTPLRLQAPPDKRMIVIDATETGELVGWAKIPHRLGTDSKKTLGEYHAPAIANPDCTQAFTFPFVLALHNDYGASKSAVKQLAAKYVGYSREEHRKDYSLMRFPPFKERSFFNYRRIVSTTQNDPLWSPPAPGDMTMVNWNHGNDWPAMDPPLILTDHKIDSSGQRQDWGGGVSIVALRHAEEHAILFAEWLLETKAQPEYPLTFLSGVDSPLGTASGLSMVPYIREGRRIVGRAAYGQRQFMMREADVRVDMSGGRDFSQSAIAVTHYDVDIHGCRYRNGEPTWEANSAPTREYNVRPVQVPLEALIPQGVDNLLVGGKSVAVSHIVNAVTRVHYSEWNIGAASGVLAGWIIKQNQSGIRPDTIVANNQLPQLRQYMTEQGLRYEW